MSIKDLIMDAIMKKWKMDIIHAKSYQFVGMENTL